MKNVVPVIENDNQLNRIKTLDLKAITKNARIWNCKKNLLFIKNLSPKHAILGLSAGTGKLCIFGHLGLVFIWSCFVSCLLFLLYYVICAPVLTEGTQTV